MDTREKIVDLPAALAISERWRRDGVNWRLITGYFDVLTPDHVRSLPNGVPLMAAILDPPGALLPLRARAELAASLRMVDYVLLLGDTDPEEAIEKLQPAGVIRAETADRRRSQALIEHVHRRQKS